MWVTPVSGSQTRERLRHTGRTRQEHHNVCHFLIVDFVADDAANGSTIDGSDRSATRKIGAGDGTDRRADGGPPVLRRHPGTRIQAAETALRAYRCITSFLPKMFMIAPNCDGRGSDALAVIPGTLLFARIALQTLQVFICSL